MDVTAAMVAFVVEKQGVKARLWGSPACAVEFVAEWGEGTREPGALYVCGDEAPARLPAVDATWAILQVSGAADAGEGPKTRRCPSPRRTPLEQAAVAIRMLDQWDARLKDALLQQVPLAEFIQTM